MADFEPAQSRKEALLQNLLGADNAIDTAQSREEKILANMLGADYELEPPQSREEELLIQLLEQGGSGVDPDSAVLITKSISANGTYNASSDNADGYKKVTVNVANTYAAGDEGKVVNNGALVSQTNETVTENGTVDTTTIKQVTVNVPTGSEPTGTKNISISQNGTTTENVAGYASAAITVAVPIPTYQTWIGGSY